MKLGTSVPAVLEPMQGGRLVLGAIALSLAVFMNVLDTSIANVSLPAIAGDLGVSPTQGTWVITSFAVANAIAVPLTGWLTQRFGQVRLFTTSVLLFVLTSWLCGLAPSIETLILFRVLQGAVAGPMIPLSQALLLSSFPRARAGTALAMWSMTTLVAPVMGPLLGGWITDNIAWSWIFYINVPVGLVSALLTWRLYRDRESRTRRAPIDLVGLILLIVWVGALQIMLDLGKERDWFESGLIVTLAVVAAAAFVFFVIWELTDEHPVVDLSLFARRNFWVGTLTISLGYGTFFGNVVLLPLWLQQFMGYTATWAGLATAPVGLLALLCTPFVGKLISKTDPRRIVTFAFLVFALVLWMRSQFTTSTDFRTIVTPIVIQGLAMATFFIPLVTIILSNLPPERIPSASGLSNFARITAGAIGTSVVTTLWENRATMHHVRLAEAVNTGNDAAVSFVQQASGGLGATPEQALAVLNQMATQQAFTLGADDLLFASAVIFLVMIPMVWLARPPKAGAAAGGEAAGAH